MCLTLSNQENLIQTENFQNSHSRNLLKNRGTLEWWFTDGQIDAQGLQLIANGVKLSPEVEGRIKDLFD